MITLNPSISITPPPITLADGTVKTFSSITLSEIDYTVTYDDSREFASALIKGVNRNVILWQGADYISAGNFTTADTDTQLKKILGSDPAAYITSLFKNPQFVKPVAPAKPTTPTA
jgi:hypothetical protein